MAYTDEERAVDYKIVFGSPLGEKVLIDILMLGHVYSIIPQGDLLMVGIGMGENNLAKRIASYVGYSPADFMRHAKIVSEDH